MLYIHTYYIYIYSPAEAATWSPVLSGCARRAALAMC